MRDAFDGARGRAEESSPSSRRRSAPARIRSDWVTDLEGRRELEAAVECALREHPRLHLDSVSTQAFDRLDFQLTSLGGRPLELELKAKAQPLGLYWRRLRPDVPARDLFVLDELAMRRIVEVGRHAFLLVRDVPASRWILWSTGDLLVASSVRASRELRKTEQSTLKGKLVLDFSEACFAASDLVECLDSMVRMANRINGLWLGVAPWPTQARHRPHSLR